MVEIESTGGKNVPSKRDRYYLRSIDRRWRNELQKAQQRVIVLSPYITSQTADLVLDCTSPKISKVYSVFSAENFASGASSIKTLIRLIERGYLLYGVDNLHAKIILIDDTFASIGSQNLTSNGVRNREASVAITDTQDVMTIWKLSEPWLKDAYPITIEMLNELEKELPDLKKEYDEARKKSKEIEKNVFIVVERHQREKWAKEIRNSLQIFFVNGDVLMEFARDIIRRSVWWLTHSSGSPVNAWGFGDRLVGSQGNWWVSFGSNNFLVGKAISRCLKVINSVVDDTVNGGNATYRDLLDRLSNAIRGSVSNYQGHEYDSYPVNFQNEMVFGAHAIDVDSVINIVLSKVPAIGKYLK